jgi:hypothetical protein
MRRYLIWSWEHHAWWRAERQGYTRNITDTGTYTLQEAGEITVGHIPPGEEIAVDDVWGKKYGPPPYHKE